MYKFGSNNINVISTIDYIKSSEKHKAYNVFTTFKNKRERVAETKTEQMW